MKKHSLLAASVAMALLGAVQQASAANVEVFGFLDQGLTYRYEDGNTGMQGPVGQSKANVLDSAGYVTQQGAGHKFEQGTGNVSTWGIKGSEKLSDNLEAIFHLENGFLPDDGTLYMNNVLFERESSVGFRSKIWGEGRPHAGHVNRFRYDRVAEQPRESVRSRLGQHDRRLEVCRYAGDRTLEQHDQLQDPRDEWGSVPLPAFLRQ